MEDKFLKESFDLIQSVEKYLNDFYNSGYLVLDRFKNYKIGVNLLFMECNQRKLVNSIPLISLKIKKKYDNKDFFVTIMNIYRILKEKDFNSLDKIFDNINNREIQVKCFCCNTKEIYKGQGIIIKSQEDFDNPISVVGEWVCGQDCYEELRD